MSEETNLAINAYIEKFGYGLPIDFELRLKDLNSDEEWVKTIQNAIDTNTPFEDEGVFWE